MHFTLDSTLGELLDHPQSKAVLEQYAPGISVHPMVGMARGVSLNMLLSLPQASQLGLTREKVQLILDEANKHV
jgi:hypothetical protein